MSNSKFLSDSGWKDIAAKNNVKDNGLLKKLADIKRIGDDKHDEALKGLDEALKLAGQLRKDKKTAPAAGKYLDDLAAAAEAALREVSGEGVSPCMRAEGSLTNAGHFGDGAPWPAASASSIPARSTTSCAVVIVGRRSLRATRIGNCFWRPWRRCVGARGCASTATC